MDSLDLCSWILSEPWHFNPNQIPTINRSVSQNMVTIWSDHRVPANVTDGALTSLIEPDICSKVPPINPNHDSANDTFFTLPKRSDHVHQHAFNEELSAKEDCEQFLLLESAKVKHRRTQNRLSQRAYRHRREEERKKLQDDLKAWQEKCRDLDETCKRLHVALNVQKKVLMRMEQDNDALRMNISPMTWEEGPQ